MGHRYLDQKHTEAQLLELKNTWAQLFKSKSILGHNYLKPKHTGAQLFSAKKYLGTAI